MSKKNSSCHAVATRREYVAAAGWQEANLVSAGSANRCRLWRKDELKGTPVSKSRLQADG